MSENASTISGMLIHSTRADIIASIWPVFLSRAFHRHILRVTYGSLLIPKFRYDRAMDLTRSSELALRSSPGRGRRDAGFVMVSTQRRCWLWRPKGRKIGLWRT